MTVVNGRSQGTALKSGESPAINPDNSTAIDSFSRFALLLNAWGVA